MCILALAHTVGGLLLLHLSCWIQVINLITTSTNLISSLSNSSWMLLKYWWNIVWNSILSEAQTLQRLTSHMSYSEAGCYCRFKNKAFSFWHRVLTKYTSIWQAGDKSCLIIRKPLGDFLFVKMHLSSFHFLHLVRLDSNSVLSFIICLQTHILLCSDNDSYYFKQTLI